MDSGSRWDVAQAWIRADGNQKSRSLARSLISGLAEIEEGRPHFLSKSSGVQMALLLPLGLGLVGGVFVLAVAGEVFYLFYWRKRPLYPRGNSVPVAPVTEREAIGAREPAGEEEVIIDVTCAEYQIAALHQDLVEKLFPALGVTSAETAKDLMGPTRMLFTITEETKEDLEWMDLDNRRSRKPSRSKSMSDMSVSPAGHLSPITSTSPFVTPPSSPEHFVTPYGTPTYSPLVALNRSHSASPLMIKTSGKVMNDPLTGSPLGPPSPTRPSFPFLSRGSSPNQTPDLAPTNALEKSEWSSPRNGKLSPTSIGTFYSPPRKPFLFATPVIHGKKVEGVVKVTSPLRSCTYVYENGTFSPSNPSSPQFSPFPMNSTLAEHFSRPLSSTLAEHFSRENQDRTNAFSSTPPSLSSASAGPCPPFYNHSASPDTRDSTSPSCKPSSQRSSSMLFSSQYSRPSPAPVLDDRSPTVSFPVTDSSSPTGSTTSRGSSWDSMCTPFIVESSSSSASAQ